MMFLPVGQDCGGSGTWVLQEAAAAVPDRLLSEAGRAPQTPNGGVLRSQH